MHRTMCSLLAAILLPWIAQPSWANPLVFRETLRDDLILELCAGGGQQQVDVLAEYGFYHLSNRATECVRRNFSLLAPHLIAAQRPPACPDFSLQRHFRKRAGQAVADSMCAALREWFAAELTSDQILGLWRLGPYVLECPDALLWARVAAAEVLADYGDPLAASPVSEMLQTIESASSRCPVIPESPAWYLQQSMDRISGRDAKAVFTPVDEGGLRVYLDASLVVSIQVYRPDARPAALVMDPGIAREAVLLLRTLGLAPSVPDERLRPRNSEMLFDSDAGIRIGFRNGLWAALKIVDGERLAYCDNARLDGNRQVFTSPRARDDLMALMSRQ